MDHLLTLRHAELQLRTLAKRSADLCVCLMHRVGIEHANRFNSELCRVDWPQKAGGLSWDWQSGPPCPFKGALAALHQGDAAAARKGLAVYASHFDGATRGAAYTATKEQIESGLMVASERLGDIGLRQVGENTLRRAYVGGFMRGLADGIGMHSPNRYTIFEAIAHRYMILDIVQYIDEGKLNTARRVLKEIPSCEAKRKPQFVPAAKQQQQQASSVGNSATDAVAPPPVVPPAAPASPPSIRPLHPLLQIICVVIEPMADHFDTRTLVMLRRTCHDATRWHAEVPPIVVLPGERPRHLGLVMRIAVSIEQRRQLDWSLGSPFHFEYSTRINMYDDLIDTVHTMLVQQRRARLVEKFVHGTCDALSGMKVWVREFEAQPQECRARLETMMNAGSTGSALSWNLERMLLVEACLANSPRALSYLMYEAGMDAGVEDGWVGTSPLHAAASVGNVALLRLVCSAGTIGASVPMPPEGQAILDDDGLSALAVAIRFGHVAAARWLVEECDWDLDDDTQIELVQHAIRMARADIQVTQASVDEIQATLVRAGFTAGEL